MSDTYRATIGLEIHAELKTQTKMFCDCLNNAEATEPNTNVCPVCMAHPGCLPVINKEAVRKVLMMGVAVNGRLAEYTEFDRKNYFYPDLPKGYQISQYEFPLISGGTLAGVAITRVHLEEDTARSSHADESGDTLIDFNRGGVPLMELVTEPVIHDAETAGNFARELQLLLRTLGVSDANMEQGQMRVEANISISSTAQLGTKVEVKNLNSFKSVERAIAFEIARQEQVLRSGQQVIQETRGWDEHKQETFSQRIKEVAADYRYFPDPDLPKLVLSEVPEFTPTLLKSAMAELPDALRARYVQDYHLKPQDIERFIQERVYGRFFEGVATQLTSTDMYTTASNLIINNLLTLSGGMISQQMTATKFAEIVRLLTEGEVSSNGAVALITALLANGESITSLKAYAEEAGLLQNNDETTLTLIVEKVMREHADVVAEYVAGKEKALGFLVGQCMKESSGSGNPQLFAKLLTR